MLWRWHKFIAPDFDARLTKSDNLIGHKAKLAAALEFFAFLFLKACHCLAYREGNETTMTPPKDQPAGGAAPRIVAADLQPGDEVTIRARVSPTLSTSEEFCVVRFHGASHLDEYWARIDSIVTHTPAPRPFAVGDRVIAMEPPWRSHAGVPDPRTRIVAIIIAIKDHLAWVEGDPINGGPSFIVQIDDLELLDG